MSDCLHCDINELVRKRLEETGAPDVAQIASMIVESLADSSGLWSRRASRQN
jgi:hypothetical protein